MGGRCSIRQGFHYVTQVVTQNFNLSLYFVRFNFNTTKIDSYCLHFQFNLQFIF